MKAKLVWLSLPLLVALLCVGCDSIDAAQKRNTRTIHTNPHAAEPTPHVAATPVYSEPEPTFEAKEEGESK